MDKENERYISKSRIPIPVYPLPPVPKHLTSEYIKANEASHYRKPLQTLSNQPGPSTSSVGKEKTSTAKSNWQKIDRHVTVKRNYDNLDWSLKVFEDIRQKAKQCDVITRIEDHTETKELQGSSRANDTVENRASTPIHKPQLLDPRVRNIKRSLKRPHSKELQGLPSQGNDGKKYSRCCQNEDLNVKRRHSYKIGLCDRLKSPDQTTKTYTLYLMKAYSTDMLEHLVSVETRPDVNINLPRITRACVVNWLMKVNGVNGNPAIIQSACWYLDSILARENVVVEKLQLLASGCYWIALKLHQTGISSMKLVKCSNYAFSSKCLAAAELTILKILDIPSQPVIPQEFIDYLSCLVAPDHPGEIEVAATFIAMSSLLVNSPLCADYPSVIAAAAVKNALLLLDKKEEMSRLLLSALYSIAVTKAKNFQGTMSAQRVAIRTVSSTNYDYRTPYDQYNLAPHFIAQNIVKAATNFVICDTAHAALFAGVVDK